VVCGKPKLDATGYTTRNYIASPRVCWACSTQSYRRLPIHSDGGGETVKMGKSGRSEAREFPEKAEQTESE